MQGAREGRVRTSLLSGRAPACTPARQTRSARCASPAGSARPGSRRPPRRRRRRGILFSTPQSCAFSMSVLLQVCASVLQRVAK